MAGNRRIPIPVDEFDDFSNLEKFLKSQSLRPADLETIKELHRKLVKNGVLNGDDEMFESASKFAQIDISSLIEKAITEAKTEKDYNKEFYSPETEEALNRRAQEKLKNFEESIEE